ncbi:MAG TPA: hypothetical protein VJ698_04485 [Noviherbaspirillum sp.]|nr:hypothetical protein [Noviherbaspirillum sp.]HJV84710.1 hypothetical protein [Noviherbaspirillum sp.]
MKITKNSASFSARGTSFYAQAERMINGDGIMSNSGKCPSEIGVKEIA